MFVGFFKFFTHRQITFDKNKTSKNKRVTFEILELKSKTDQHREGHIVYISRVSSECFPVKFLEKYLQKTNIEISKDGETPLTGITFVFEDLQNSIPCLLTWISFFYIEFSNFWYLKCSVPILILPWSWVYGLTWKTEHSKSNSN